MSTCVLAESAATWAALGAVATLFTALVTLFLGVVYTGRQTEYSRRAAANARVSADAATAATRLAERNLGLVADQLQVVRDQTAVLQQQVDLGLLAIKAQDRPAVVLEALDIRGSRISTNLRNCGRGTAWVSRGRIVVGPDSDNMHTAMKEVARLQQASVGATCWPGVLGVGETAEVESVERVSVTVPAIVWVVFPVRDFRGAETWTYYHAYRVLEDDGDAFEPAGFHASEGLRLGDDEVEWPVAELDDRRAPDAESG